MSVLMLRLLTCNSDSGDRFCALRVPSAMERATHFDFQLHACEVSRPSLSKICPHTDILKPGNVPTTTPVVVPATKRCTQEHVSPWWHTPADLWGGKHYLAFLLTTPKSKNYIHLQRTRNNSEYFVQNFYFISLEKCNIWSLVLRNLRTAVLAIISCFGFFFIEVNSRSEEEEEERSTSLRVLRRKKWKILSLCSLETENDLKHRKHHLIYHWLSEMYMSMTAHTAFRFFILINNVLL